MWAFCCEICLWFLFLSTTYSAISTWEGVCLPRVNNPSSSSESSAFPSRNLLSSALGRFPFAVKAFVPLASAQEELSGVERDEVRDQCDGEEGQDEVIPMDGYGEGLKAKPDTRSDEPELLLEHADDEPQHQP